MQDKASLTALMAAYARAYHTEHSPDPVFADPVVRQLLTDGEYARIGAYIADGASFFGPDMEFESAEAAVGWIVSTQLAPTPLARARFCEDGLRAAMRAGVTQYVMLGAGLDTFAWREPELLARLTVFEADHPATQADKRARLERAGLDVPARLRFVPVDFTADDLAARLLAEGFDPARKTFFSWLGVTYYLTEAEIGRVLDNIARVAGEGSTLVFDYPDAGLFDAAERRVRSMVAMAEAGGEPMRFAADEPTLTALLERHRFLLYEHLAPPEIQAAYFDGRGDGMTAFEHVSYALAALHGAQELGTKEKIVRAALALFSRYGYEAVSTRDIAERVAITKGALYRHFADKRCILDEIAARLTAMPDPPPAPGTPPAAWCESVYRRWTRDAFLAACRRLLALERFRDPPLAVLWRRLFLDAPLEHAASLVGADGAVALYAPVLLLFALYDAGDEDGAETRLRAHLARYTE